MQAIDIQDYVERYEKRLQQYGYDPRTLGWGKNGRQEVRFSILAEEAIKEPHSSVLDVGCGFADLYAFLKQKGWQGTYVGLDIVPGLLKVAKERFPNVDVRLLDINTTTEGLQTYDYVIASGVMNAKLPSGTNEINFKSLLRAMYALAHKAVCLDFMTTLVDFQHAAAWHTHPSVALTEAMNLSNKFKLRHDYMPFEFALFIYKETAISPRNVFETYEKALLD